MKITYILLWKNCNVGTTCEFYICLLNYPLFFQISANYEKILLKFVSLSIALARPGAILSVEGEITCIKKGVKIYKFRIGSGMYKSYIIIIINIKKQ